MRFDNADEALRAAVVHRFAELDAGSPVRCRGCPDHKIVFEDRRATEGAIRALRALDGDHERYPYPCPYSTAWHYTRQDRGGEDAT